MRSTGFILAFLSLTVCGPSQPPDTAGLPPDAAKGKELYQDQNCNGCHGDSGLGDGPAGQALVPRPRNYRDLASYKKGTSQEQIAAMLEYGIEGSAMKGYAHLTPEKRKQLAAYVVWLQREH